MKTIHLLPLVLILAACQPVETDFSGDPSPHAAAPAEKPRLVDGVPANAPRTFLLQGDTEAFRAFCLEGPMRDFYAQMKEEFDRKWLHGPLPSDPEEYGDPDPSKRTPDKVVLWRRGQADCNQIVGIAEAALVFWKVTGDPVYLERAKAALLEAATWGFGESEHTLYHYNDEAHFRLWRKMPMLYDQLRDQFSESERETLLHALRERGNQSFEEIEVRNRNVVRNSIEVTPRSHAIRFASMTGLAGLALWDDLPEARDWFESAHRFYTEQFPPWGGDDGGWAEGPAYWRGNLEHARFHNALTAFNSPAAFAGPFWENTGYFPLYFVLPYPHTAFGDNPVAGQFSLEPIVGELVERLARRFDDGYLLSYSLMRDRTRRSVESQGLYFEREMYPTGMEYLLNAFATRHETKPEPEPLENLPGGRWFRDIGWVAMRSHLANPALDVMVSFKSSPYGSFSHSHADQNAFILHAYGEDLLINSGYREYHRSPHHVEYYRQTCSKNALLIGGRGQLAQSKEATGEILGFKETDRMIWTAGDAATAYNVGTPRPSWDPLVREARRDMLKVDNRYVVIRDRVVLSEPETISFLLHMKQKPQWDPSASWLTLQLDNAGCGIAMVSPGAEMESMEIEDTFPVPLAPGYDWPNQVHVNATYPANTEHLLYTVIWIWPGTGEPDRPVELTLRDNTLTVFRPDGQQDRIDFREEIPRLGRAEK